MRGAVVRDLRAKAQDQDGGILLQVSLADDGLRFDDLTRVSLGHSAGGGAAVPGAGPGAGQAGAIPCVWQGTPVTVGSGPTTAAFWRIGCET